MLSAITISLVPEARGGPFVFWDNLGKACQSAAALGFDAVEIFPRSVDELDAREVRKILGEFPLKLAAMGTGAGWVVRKLRLTDPDPAVRKRAQEFAASIIDLAGSLGAPAILGSMQGRWDPPVTREEALDWLGESLEILAPRALGFGVPLLLEPLNRYETNLLNRVSDATAFLDRLTTRNVQLLCDLFHMNIEEANIAEALRRAGPKLGHVHFADSNRQAIGFGHTEIQPVAETLRSLGFAGFISAEVLPWPNPEAAAAQTIASYRRYFPAH